MSELVLTRDQFLEMQKIGIGAFAPLTGFMQEEDFTSVIDTMRLRSGDVFTLPVYLDVSATDAERLRGRPRVTLIYDGEAVGEIEPQSIYSWDRERSARAVFGVLERAHPGVAKMLDSREKLIGGRVTLHPAGYRFLFDEELSPQQTRAIFVERGWRTVAGFQTRNVPHRAHEYLHRLALEQCDGLFVQPLLGRKKAGDYTPDAVMSSYKALVREFLPRGRVLLGVLSTAMRYAGPREAVFHAIIRRNYGCTHFIIGRDHAGVGSYYGKYDGHALAARFGGELGIEIIPMAGPFYCRICDGIATERTCNHATTQPDAVTDVSGTLMRQILSSASTPRPELMRPGVLQSLQGISLFIEADEP